ncbi:MAG: EAL domain-containing protein, partial [Betaproteobacteria bacterium]|nr:EAL domain-containing protein [Betaproteobacteria bacterium]
MNRFQRRDEHVAGRRLDLRPGTLAKAAFWAALYTVVGLSLLSLSPGATTSYVMLWPSAAIAVMAALRLGPVALPFIFAAAGLVEWIDGGPAPLVIAEAGAAVLEAAIAWLVLRRVGLGREEFPARALGVDIPVVSLLAPAPAAAAFAGVYALVHGVGIVDASHIAVLWWLSDAVGIMVFLPLLVVWRHPPRSLPGHPVHSAGLLTCHALISGFVFFGGASTWLDQTSIAYLTFPVALLIAVNAGSHLATLAVAVVAVFGLVGTLNGVGPFTFSTPTTDHLLLELFLAINAGSTLFVHGLAAAQRNAANQLREGFDRFRSLAALSADWYWETDVNQRFTRVSGRAVDSGLLDPANFIGRSRWELPCVVTDEERQRHDSAMARRESFRDLMLTRLNMGDTPRHVSISGEPVLDESGRFAGYRGVGRDVTVMKQAEHEIAQSRGFLKALIDAIPSPVLLKDGQHRYVEANPSFVEFFERPLDRIVGRTDFDFFTREDATYFLSTDQAALRGDGPVTYERPYRIHDSIRWMLVRKTALTAPDGKRYILLVLFDVTGKHATEERLRESEQRFRSLTELSADWYWEQDDRYRYTYLSDSAAGHMVETGSELIGRTRFEAEFDWPSDQAMRDHRATLDARRPFRDLVLRSRKTGRWGLSSGEPVFDAGGAFKGYRGVGRDITDLKTVEEQLRESERRFRDFAEAASEFVWEQDAHGAYTYLSPRVRNVLGYANTELIGRRPADLMPAGENERVSLWLDDHVRPDGSYKDLEHMLLTRSGSIVWVSVNAVAMRDEAGRAVGQRGTARDITDRKAAEERISQLATRDALTGLPNRLLLQDRLEQGLVNSRRNRESLALMFIDLDRFKNINDSLGHDVGDLLLKEVATRMQTCIRKGDTLARLGGDEFVITLEGLQQAEDAAHVADKITAALARPVEVRAHTLNTSCSIGISIFPDDAEDAATLMKNADTAMYHAKEKGRRNYQFFSREMNIRAVERHDLENALRLALNRDEFVLHYQPQIDIATGRIAGVEALLRWKHPVKGLVAPATFIEVAEETGLIEPIGAWALRAACEQNKAWQDAGYPALRVAVNVSARQFHQPNEFARAVQRILARTGLDPMWLELEMTESVLWQSADESIQAFRKLGKLGTRLAVDDFGTGYSSLATLKQLPIDTLKIDRSFVRDVDSDKGSDVIVATIVGMAHSLNLRVTAEGVENLAQLSTLK